MAYLIQRFLPGNQPPGFVPLLLELCAESIGKNFESF